MGLFLRTHVRPLPWPVPFHELLTTWVGAGLEPGACRRATEAAIAAGVPEGLLDPAQVTAGGVVATPALLQGSRADESWLWVLAGRTFEVPADATPAITALIRIAAEAESRDEALASARDVTDDVAILASYAEALEDTHEHGTWPPVDAPGIYRREHASLVIRTPGGATLVIDPQRLGSDWTTHFGAYPAERSSTDGNVLVTHSHDDHFDVASIASHAGPGSEIVVPHVPAPSLLSDDMQAVLARAGLSARSPGWWEQLRFSDVTVEILPFYGEQPTRSLPQAHGLRSWGNCYRIDFGDWSLGVLADSGQDPEGSMIDALRRSCSKSGPIDVLVSCCFEFSEMINLGLPHYAFTVPFEALRARRGKGASITSGPAGVAEACRVTGARYFLPYAHGFTRLFAEPASGRSRGQLSTEDEAAKAVEAELRRMNCKTGVLRWSPGDVLRWRGRAVVERAH